ncbi:MAG: family hydrolase [Herbinix sp.]|jgi:phosphoglycolate phosphatase|nr:family hydrolase [Herbinix sp.]
MIPYHKIQTIFFDYDGTLHDSMQLYGPAFRKAYDVLVKEGAAEDRTWSDQEIGYWLGYNPKDMWQSFMPDLADNIRQQCSNIIGEEMISLMNQGKAKLYKGALEMLDYLQRLGLHLIFISNCKVYYKECHNRLFQLDHYFEEMVCSAEYQFIPKHEILGQVMKQYPKEMVIIGDRKHDMEAGKLNHIYTIGCSYGFGQKGELDNADLIIKDIKELYQYF